MDFKLHRPIRKWMVWIPGVLIVALLAFLVWRSAESTIRITLGGDVMLARNGASIIDGAADFGDALPELRQADVAMANLESPLAYEPSLYSPGFNLCASATSAEILYNTGLDVVSIANNHTYDCNPTGDLETLKWLNQIGITGVGGIDSVRILRVKEQPIAILAYEDVSKALDIDKMLSEVENARNISTILIVSMHWGMEYQAGPSARQMQIAQQLADAGVDVVWGHHSHVLQRIEWLTGKDSAQKTLVIYSLGNLISDQYMRADTQKTALVTLSLRNGKIAGMSVEPLAVDRTSHLLRMAQETDSAWILACLKWGTEIPPILSFK